MSGNRNFGKKISAAVEEDISPVLPSADWREKWNASHRQRYLRKITRSYLVFHLGQLAPDVLVSHISDLSDDISTFGVDEGVRIFLKRVEAECCR